MSKLEELILKYCPDGVERVRLGDYFTRIKGTPITAGVMKEIANENGDVRIFAGGKTIVNAFEKDIPNANITKEPAVLVQSRGVIDFVYYDKPFTFKSEMWAYTHTELITLKFLYYYCKNNVDYFRAAAGGMGSMPQISLPVTENFTIPLPPLPVQEEIVRILDSMVDLQNNIEAELKERKKQYEHYRDSFLSSDELNKKEIDWKSLQEVGYFYGGLNGKTKNDFVNGNAKYITYMNIYSHPKLSIDIKDKVSVLPNEKQNTIEYCDILFTGSSETSDECGMSSVVTQHIKEPIYLNSFCFGYRFNSVDNIHPNYMVHLFRSKDIRDKIGETANGVTRFNISKKAFGDILIPIPSIKIQKEIANKLDIMIDFIDNLEAELVERRRQYEYYRNKLLSFE